MFLGALAFLVLGMPLLLLSTLTLLVLSMALLLLSTLAFVVPLPRLRALRRTSVLHESKLWLCCKDRCWLCGDP